MADSNVLMPRDYRRAPAGDLAQPTPGWSARRRSDARRTASGPNSNARSSTPIRRAGSAPPTAPASASPRARRCCGVATCWPRTAASRRWQPRSPKTPPRPSWCAAPGCACVWSSSPFEQPLGERRAARRLAPSGALGAAAARHVPASLRARSVRRSAAAADRLRISGGRRGISAAAAVLALAIVWYGAEAALARAAGWHLDAIRSPHLLLRDVLLPAIWLAGWAGKGFEWRGNSMRIVESKQSA